MHFEKAELVREALRGIGALLLLVVGAILVGMSCQPATVPDLPWRMALVASGVAGASAALGLTTFSTLLRRHRAR